MKQKVKKIILFGIKLFICVVVIRGLVIYIMTPKENLNFQSESDYNNITLKKGDEFKIEAESVRTLFGFSSMYLLVYKHEYIGYISSDSELYAMDSIDDGEKTIIYLRAGYWKYIYPLGIKYCYLDIDNKLTDSRYYFYIKYDSSARYNDRENALQTLNLVKKTETVTFNKDKYGQKASEINGLNLVKKGKKKIFSRLSHQGKFGRDKA